MDFSVFSKFGIHIRTLEKSQKNLKNINFYKKNQINLKPRKNFILIRGKKLFTRTKIVNGRHKALLWF